MSKKSAPKPPQLTYPEPTSQEQGILKRQEELLAQSLAQGDSLFKEGQGDRSTMRTMLSMLEDKTPYQLDDTETKMLDDIRDAHLKFSQDSFNSGVDKEIFDKERNDSIAGLARRGVLDSSVAAQILGSQENQRQRLLQTMASDTALKRLMMGQDKINQGLQMNQNIAQLYSDSGRQLPGIATNLSGSASTQAGQVAQQLANERTAKFNVNAQNQQLAYQSALAKPKRSAGGFGALGGAALGAILAGAATGGMGAAAGAQLGGMLGGAGGSLFSY